MGISGGSRVSGISISDFGAAKISDTLSGVNLTSGLFSTQSEIFFLFSKIDFSCGLPSIIVSFALAKLILFLHRFQKV